MSGERAQPTWHHMTFRFAADSEAVGTITTDQIMAGLRVMLDLPDGAEILLDEATMTAVPRWRTRAT